jgi:hypothetical protein
MTTTGVNRTNRRTQQKQTLTSNELSRRPIVALAWPFLLLHYTHL